MNKATLPQATAILTLFLETPLEQVQAILASGLLADLRDGNIAQANRGRIRRELGLRPLKPPASKSHTVDLDAAPFCPKGWTVIGHHGNGQLDWKPERAEIFLSDAQGSGTIVGHDLHVIVACKKPYNANLLDWLLAHPEEIPASWKRRYVFYFFWGTIYRSSLGDLRVRYLFWDSESWCWGYDELDNRWGAAMPAAVPASVP
ncbi:MAG: hypothetical protein PHT12_00690 [Patescibacteria group bacterium]|nr:hypothetical protein [Patescibacteria group bacterium]